MDSFTQIALGATIGEAGWRKELGGKATIWGGLCGLLPDLDVVAGAIDPWADLTFHRSWTHSLLVLPLAAIPIGWLGHRFAKKRGSLGQWVHLCFWALITHPLLDLFTAYGTQLFAPLSDRRYAIDGVSIIDLFYSLPLLVVCLMALKRGDPPRWRRRFAAGVLVLTTSYLFVGWATMRSVREAARQDLVAQGFEPEAIRALPSFLNNQAFRVIARRGDDFRIGYWSNVAGAGTSWLERRSAADEAAGAILSTERGRIFEWFADGYVWIHPRDEGGYALVDLRFGGISNPVFELFAAHAFREGDGWRLERAERASPDFGGEPAALWSVIRTGTADAWPGN